jgi:hypothetical protein
MGTYKIIIEYNIPIDAKYSMKELASEFYISFYERKGKRYIDKFYVVSSGKKDALTLSKRVIKSIKNLATKEDIENAEYSQNSDKNNN